MKKSNIYLLLICIAFAAACNPSTKEQANEEQTTTTEEKADKKALNSAKAVISSSSESKLTGEAIFTELEDGGVSLKLTVENATPGSHAVHLHEKGDCSAPDATSAGGHWNPADVRHGKRPVDSEFHAGDIDNLMVGEDGKGELTMTVEGWTVGGPDSTNVINKAIIIHAQADDFESQPSGAAGERVGCGVIEKN